MKRKRKLRRCEWSRFHQIRGRKSWRKEVKLEAAKVMKPRSELNLGFGRAIAFWVFRLGRDRVEFERCCLTRRRGGAEKHAENIFSGLASVLARLRRKVKTCERGDSGDRTASQRGSRWGGRLTNAARGGYRSWSGAFRCWQGEGRQGPNIGFLRTSRSARRLFRLGWDRVEFERCCLTRRRGGAEKHAENIFSGLASELARLRRKVKTWERGDSGDRTASQRGSRWGGRLTNAAHGGYRNAV